MAYYRVPFPEDLSNVEFAFHTALGAIIGAWSSTGVAARVDGFGYGVTATAPEGAAEIWWRASEVVEGETVDYRATAGLETPLDISAALEEYGVATTEDLAALDLSGVVLGDIPERLDAVLALFENSGSPPLVAYSVASIPGDQVVVAVPIKDNGVARNDLTVTARIKRTDGTRPISANGADIEADGTTEAVTGAALTGHEEDFPATDGVAWLLLFKSSVLRDTAGNADFPWMIKCTGTKPTLDVTLTVEEPGVLWNLIATE